MFIRPRIIDAIHGVPLGLTHRFALAGSCIPSGGKPNPPIRSSLAAIITELSDGTYIVTTNDKQRFKSAPSVTVHRALKAPPAALLDLHNSSMGKLPNSTSCTQIRTQGDLDDVSNRYEKVCRDEFLKRGLHVKMSPDEVRQELQVLSGAQQMQTQDGQYSDVLLELSQLQNKKPGGYSGLVILVVSIILFMIVGGKQWSWSYVVILVPLLLFHEVGHYLAMRAFNYRNLRMFFIPLFGAAVSGVSYNVPGWKKVIVSLMGPVPGIFLGVILGAIGLLLHNPLLVKIATISLILNGFNLLPLLPLDGG